MKKINILLSALLVSGTASANSARDLQYSASCSGATTANISFIGDVLVHRAIYESVANGTKQFSQIWYRTDSMIQKADFSVANLEGPAALGIDSKGKDRGDVGFVYDGNVYSGTNFVFNFHPRILNNLKSSGYDLISFANNHSMDRYSIGVDKTIAAARDVGLLTAGARIAQEREASFATVTNIKGINVAFVACTESLNGRSDAKNQILNCYNNQTEALIASLSKNSSVDFVVVMPHWGEEYKPSPNSRQVSFAKKYIEAGAGAVIGSHPHVLQPWEKYVAKDGREALIIYSMGNFVAWQSGINRKTGPVAYLGLAKRGNGQAEITGVGYSLTQRQGEAVYPVEAQHIEYIKNAQSYYGKQGFILPSQTISSWMCPR